MQTAIDVTAHDNAEYTKTVISKAADIIEDLAAGKKAWTAIIALEEADRELRTQNGHSKTNFSLTAVINSLNKHLNEQGEANNRAPQSPLEALSPGCNAETAATKLREAAPEVAREVLEWTLRTEKTLLEIAQLPITQEDVEEAVREAKGK